MHYNQSYVCLASVGTEAPHTFVNTIFPNNKNNKNTAVSAKHITTHSTANIAQHHFVQPRPERSAPYCQATAAKTSASAAARGGEGGRQRRREHLPAADAGDLAALALLPSQQCLNKLLELGALANAVTCMSIHAQPNRSSPSAGAATGAQGVSIGVPGVVAVPLVPP